MKMNILSGNIEKYLCCSRCKGALKLNNRIIFCIECAQQYPLIDGDIPDMTVDVTSETEISLIKWDKLYKSKKYLRELERDYKKYFLNNIVEQLDESMARKFGDSTFLEIGSGSGIVGEHYAKEGFFFIGIDFSKNALKYLKKRLLEDGIDNFFLIRGDIQNMPIKSNTIGVIYGGGVIEHFKNTQIVIDHLYRILKPGGITFNSVPVFNIGNLIYRSRWGGIPNVPLLKQIAELIHIKILRSKHMIFGYELQFTQKQLTNLHKLAGFKLKKIHISNFRCVVQLNGIRHPKLREFLINLCKTNSHFWPGVKIVAQK